MNTVSPLNNSQIPQSLLLIGGTKTEAFVLAKQILGNSAKVDSGNHPDLHYYIPEGKSGLHPIAHVHQLIAEMALPPFEAKNKVFILEEAEKMLPSASNAMLKTLEEPCHDTFFLLLSHHPDRLLPTILSRLYPVKYPSSEVPSTDFRPFINLALQGEWDRLLDELPDECPEDFLRSCLSWAAEQKNAALFKRISAHVEQAEKALHHNIKPKGVFLNLLFQMV